MRWSLVDGSFGLRSVADDVSSCGGMLLGSVPCPSDCGSADFVNDHADLSAAAFASAFDRDELDRDACVEGVGMSASLTASTFGVGGELLAEPVTSPCRFL